MVAQFNGVGKTETMLSVLVAEGCPRLLVVVPTDALRTQIAEKFLSLGLLKTPAFQVVSDQAQYPVVGVLNKRPTDAAQVDSFFRKCNVVVTTMAARQPVYARSDATDGRVMPMLVYRRGAPRGSTDLERF
jgi:hypothetical protein